MTETTCTYVELLYPGIFLPEESTMKVAHRDPITTARCYPAAYSFQFYDLTTVEVIVDGKSRTASGDRKNLSPKYYPNGRVLTQKEVASEDGDHRILISNMEGNGWDRVVKTRAGNYQPFEKDCELINIGA
jgi:hypothetical protein